MFFMTEGYLPPPPPGPGCSAIIPATTGSGWWIAAPVEMVIFKPNSNGTLCGVDIIMRELSTASASITFVVYESTADDPNSLYDVYEFYVARLTYSVNPL
jgi:hypothetical protein